MAAKTAAGKKRAAVKDNSLAPLAQAALQPHVKDEVFASPVAAARKTRGATEASVKAAAKKTAKEVTVSANKENDQVGAF